MQEIVRNDRSSRSPAEPADPGEAEGHGTKRPKAVEPRKEDVGAEE